MILTMLLLNHSRLTPVFDLLTAFLLQAKGPVLPTEEDTPLCRGVVRGHSISHQTVSWDTGQTDFLEFR